MNKRITTLLFDLGGVLVDWDGTQPLLELTQNRLSPDQARRFWLESISPISLCENSLRHELSGSSP